MSLFNDQLTSVTLAPDVRGERQFLPLPEELPKRSLSLRDRGYLDIDYFQQLEEREAYVICRSHKGINPVVREVRGVPRQLARKLKGKRLAQVPLSKLKGAAEFVVDFERKAATTRLRLIMCKLKPNPRRGPKRPRKKRPPARSTWMYLLTNLPEERFTAEDIGHLYRLRWQIELLFKDWKSYASLRITQSENPAIVEGLIWAALCAAFLKRALAHWAQIVHHRPISTRVAAQVGLHTLRMMATWATQTDPSALNRIFVFLAENAARAHPNRDRGRP